MTSRWLRRIVIGAGALALLATPVAAAAQAGSERGNGRLGLFSGEPGDPALGARLYAQRCASCHDAPTGRTPAKAALAANTPIFILTTLSQGVMRPMAQGLTMPDMAAIAAYLSTRRDAGVSPLGREAPPCADKPPPLDLSAASQWNGWGRDREQSRFQPNPGFAAADAPRLKLKWAFAYAGARNGQATVIGERLFVNSFSGAVYALNARSGCAYWRFDLPAPSRSSIIAGPLPDGRRALYFSDFSRHAYALDADTGKLIWRTQVDDQQEVQMTGSLALEGRRLFVPVSSAEEAIATDDGYGCCRFRGAVAALDAVTGERLWKTYVTPDPPRPFRKNAKGVQMYGPAGGAIWSAPTVDAKRGLIYVATGDSYTDVPLPTSDAILALDMRTGAIRWSRQLTADDNYIIGCYGAAPKANCPGKVGPDHDFGASPILHTLPSGKQVILAGQKSSQVYALDPDARGAVVWSRRLSPGGALGGVEFSLAVEGGRVYAPLADLFNPPGAGRPGLHALAASDGQLLWSAPTPVLPCAWKGTYCAPAMSQAISAMPGVVFGGSMDGRLRAFETATGRVLWEFDTASQPVPTLSGQSAIGGVLDGAGPTIAGGMVYVNSGYQGRSGTPGSVLMAFSVDGR